MDFIFGGKFMVLLVLYKIIGKEGHLSVLLKDVFAPFRDLGVCWMEVGLEELLEMSLVLGGI